MKKLLIIKYFFIILAGLLLGNRAFAFIITPTDVNYNQNSPESSLITFSDFGATGHYAMYNSSTGVFLTEGELATDPGDPRTTLYITNVSQLDYLQPNPVLTYLTFVLFPSGFSVDEPSDTLTEAQAHASRISSVNVTISPVGRRVAAITRKSTLSHAPSISIFSPKKNSFFSNSISIDYEVTDKNDVDEIEEKTNYGLGNKPVSIFYTDKSFNWSEDTPILISSDYKNLIVKDLASTSKYEWNVKDLVPGNLYRIIINAMDNSGVVSEKVSDYFTVDFTSPLFKVKTNPVLVKSGDVTITVESSEDLQQIPKVFVTQMGGEQVKLSMRGEKDVYEGVYTVVGGYDGTANVSVEGLDLAGNVGTDIISGGTFSVGVNPPPKPVITSSINKTVTNLEFVNVSGTTRPDTEVSLSLNGTIINTLKPNSIGNFTFEKIKLEKIKNKGTNYINITSRDVFGIISEPASIEIKYNISPTVSIVKPIDKSTISGLVDIIAKGIDSNLDNLLYTYEIISISDYRSNISSKNGEKGWTTISSDIPGGSYTYNTSEVDNGEYMIRARVSDGNATATSTPISVNIKTSSAYFRFENGRKTDTKESGVVINGRAIIPAELAETVSIKSIDYSKDNGKTWENVKFDDVIPVKEQKFSVEFSGLKEGVNQILWRIIDSRDLEGRGSHNIIFDKTSPKSPIIKNYKNNVVLTNNDDENLKRPGVQVSIVGLAEAGSNVSMTFNGETLKTRASFLGEFRFSDVTFSDIGKKDFQFIAFDEVGNVSEIANLTLLYNNPPIINIINPKPFGGLSNNAVLSWSIKDLDGDQIKNVEISYRNNNGTFRNIISNRGSTGTYLWDTSNLRESGDYELRIAAADSLTSVSSVVNFLIDRTPPLLTSLSIKKEITNKKVGFIALGTASDRVSSIEYVEYSIQPKSTNQRSPWYKGTITGGYLQKQASFNFKYPGDLDDDLYTIYVRAVDIAGNVSSEMSRNIYVDKIAPRIGSFYIEKEGLSLIPNEEGEVSYYKDNTFNISISIENDAESASLLLGDKVTRLNKNIHSGLWEAAISLDSYMKKDILVTVTDTSGNVNKNKKIGSIQAINKGKVITRDSNNKEEPISEFKILVNKKDVNTGKYVEFTQNLDKGESEIKTDEKGEYDLILPIGEYEIIAIKSGFKTIKENIALLKSEIVNRLFITKRISGFEKVINDVFVNWFY